MLVRFVSLRGPFTCDGRKTEVVIENGGIFIKSQTLLEAQWWLHYFVPKKTNKKIYIMKKDHPLNWTLVSARNESRIMRKQQQKVRIKIMLLFLPAVYVSGLCRICS